MQITRYSNNSSNINNVSSTIDVLSDNVEAIGKWEVIIDETYEPNISRDMPVFKGIDEFKQLRFIFDGCVLTNTGNATTTYPTLRCTDKSEFDSSYRYTCQYPSSNVSYTANYTTNGARLSNSSAFGVISGTSIGVEYPWDMIIDFYNYNPIGGYGTRPHWDCYYSSSYGADEWGRSLGRIDASEKMSMLDILMSSSTYKLYQGRIKVIGVRY